MPEARDRLSRPVDLFQLYSRRVTRFGVARYYLDDFTPETPYRWGTTPLTGTPGASGGSGSALRGTMRARRGRGLSASGRVIVRENVSPASRGRGRGSHLPSWYPRRPLQDITFVSRVYQRRRERLRDDEDEQQPETPIAQLEHINTMITPFPTLKSRLCPPSLEKVSKMIIDVADQNSKEGEELLTPQRKLLNSIETVQKVFEEELRKLERTPSAKRAERAKKVRTLMSMR